MSTPLIAIAVFAGVLLAIGCVVGETTRRRLERELLHTLDRVRLLERERGSLCALYDELADTYERETPERLREFDDVLRGLPAVDPRRPYLVRVSRRGPVGVWADILLRREVDTTVAQTVLEFTPRCFRYRGEGELWGWERNGWVLIRQQAEK